MGTVWHAASTIMIRPAAKPVSPHLNLPCVFIGMGYTSEGWSISSSYQESSGSLSSHVRLSREESLQSQNYAQQPVYFRL